MWFPCIVINVSIKERVYHFKSHGTFLVVQRLGLCDPAAGGLGSAPGWGVEIPQATQCSQTEKRGRSNKKEIKAVRADAP